MSCTKKNQTLRDLKTFENFIIFHPYNETNIPTDKVSYKGDDHCLL